MNYWVAVVARNAARHLPKTLGSLLNQAQKPERVTIVDDGSTDETPQILNNYRERHESIFNIVTLPDRGYDIRRVPSNINLAWKTTTASGLKCDFFMVSGDDCFYPSTYTRLLLAKMEADNRMVVTSGRPASSSDSSREHSPSGSGRMISSAFWKEVGATYPLRAGWETWLLYAASARGLKAHLFGDIVFEHLRPRGTGHQFLYWGAAMQTLGYHPLYALGRITKNLLLHPLAMKGPMNMFRGYLQAKLGSGDPFISPFDQFIRTYVRQEQAHKIASIVVSLV